MTTMESEASLSQVGGVTGGLRRPRLRTATERNWVNSLLLVLASVAVFYVGFLIEMDRGLWNREIRLVRDPSESAMRFTALSHFVVAILFMMTSRRMKKARSWLWFGVSLMAGIVLCVGYYRLGMVNPMVATTLFFTYFLIHDYRDQVTFYVANGDSGELSERGARNLSIAPLMAIGTLVVIVTIAAAFGMPGTAPVLPSFGSLGDQQRMIVGSILGVALLAALTMFTRSWKSTFPMPLREVIRQHRPIAMVFVGSVAVLAASAIAGASGDAVILLHVCSWYVFTIHQLSKRKPEVTPRVFSWRWIRSTVAGFNFVHVGSFVLIVIAASVWAYGYRNDAGMDAFALTLGRFMFPFWTILHVTVSVPRS
ncbi:MAG TPA: hypothetical protein VF701_12325 [Thermoanaerobaculia bacterium]